MVSTLISVFADYIDAYLPAGAAALQSVHFVMSFALISLLFAAIYKVLPDADLSWHDVLFGAVVTALLFNFGKYLIGLYLAYSTLVSSYGAAGTAYRGADVDLLLRPDLLVRGRTHQNPCGTARDSGGNSRAKLKRIADALAAHRGSRTLSPPQAEEGNLNEDPLAPT